MKPEIPREEIAVPDLGTAKTRPADPASEDCINKPDLAQTTFVKAASRHYVPSFLRHGAFHTAHRLQQALRHEAETGTKFLMLPVAFGVGILFYFSLPREPLLAALLFAFFASVAIIIKTYGSRSGNIAVIVMLVFAGMVAGKVRSDVLDTRMIGSPVQARISGIVLNREERANGRQRYTIAVGKFDKTMSAAPEKIRVTAHAKYARVEIGEGLSGLVRLRRPSGPAYPGGYDFAFKSWFDGIGANGFFLGEPQQETAFTGSSQTFWATIAIARARAAIGSRIRETLPGESGRLAAALIVGDRSGISAETTEVLRRSGLAHILAISGLHMALVTATLIFLVRGVLAMIPGVALYYPIRKWAAFSALVAASIYLVISGGGIATQRAWIMIVIMLLAILGDRRALTMRNVALAALVILAWRPESIVSPSFQMSFAAVAALVAVYESWSRYRRGKGYRQPSGRWWPWFTRFVKSMSGLAMTSVVAGIATGLFAAYHFHRIAPFGLLANLAAMPIVSIAVMPSALAAMVLMPFGLESYPLAVMGMAIDEVVKVAGKVANLGPLGNTGFVPLSSLFCGTIALIIATQFKTILRLFAVPFVVVALMIYATAPGPDILISQSGNSVAILDPNGRLHLLRPRKEKFITNIWKKAFAPAQAVAGDGKKSGSAMPNGEIYKCDELGCTARARGGTIVAISSRAEAFREDCQRADVIVTRLLVPGWCTKPKLIVDKAALQKYGSHMVTISGSNLDVKFDVTTAYGRFSRPWSK